MQQIDPQLTVDEYLALDAESEERLEFWYGTVVAMSGESWNHSLVKAAVVQTLEAQSACTVLPSGLRVSAPSYGRQNYAYPDALMVCGEPRFDDSDNPPTLLNPALLVEVTSASTRSRDLGDKLDAYFRIESLVEYWTIDPEQAKARRHERMGDGILLHGVQGLDAAVESSTLEVRVPLSELYRRVTWGVDAPDRSSPGGGDG